MLGRLPHDLARRVAACQAHDSATGVTAGTAQEQAGHRGTVLGRTRDRAHHQELVEGKLGVVPVAATDAELRQIRSLGGVSTRTTVVLSTPYENRPPTL